MIYIYIYIYIIHNYTLYSYIKLILINRHISLLKIVPIALGKKSSGFSDFDSITIIPLNSTLTLNQ